MSNRATGEQTEANGRTHDCARGGTTVLQAQKGGTASSTAVLVTVHGRTAVRCADSRDITSVFAALRGFLRLGFQKAPQLGFLSPSLKPH